MGDYGTFNTEVTFNHERWHEFEFFHTMGVDGVETLSIAPGKRFKLRTIEIHLSVAFASTEDLVVQLSAAVGSAYNTKYLSYPMSGVTDLFVHYSDPLPYRSDDHLKFTLSLVSGTNVVGFRVTGWAALG